MAKCYTYKMEEVKSSLYRKDFKCPDDRITLCNSRREMKTITNQHVRNDQICSGSSISVQSGYP